jgi:RHS repeat-associated protein
MPVRQAKAGSVVTKSFVGESMWKRVEPSGTTYFLPGERIENGKHRKYYDGFAERDPDDGGKLKFYHGDHLGSSTLVTDPTISGFIAHRAAYYPYGEKFDGTERLDSASFPFKPKYQFNFKEKEVADVGGFYDYGARIYNPRTGRFLSADSSTVDGLNRYAYVGNSPLRYVDPTGHQQVSAQAPADDIDFGGGVFLDLNQQQRQQKEQALKDLKTVTAFIDGAFTFSGVKIILSLESGPIGYAASFLQAAQAPKDQRKAVLMMGVLPGGKGKAAGGVLDFLTRAWNAAVRTPVTRGCIWCEIDADLVTTSIERELGVTANNAFIIKIPDGNLKNSWGGHVGKVLMDKEGQFWVIDTKNFDRPVTIQTWQRTLSAGTEVSPVVIMPDGWGYWKGSFFPKPFRWSDKDTQIIGPLELFEPPRPN